MAIAIAVAARAQRLAPPAFWIAIGAMGLTVTRIKIVPQIIASAEPAVRGKTVRQRSPPTIASAAESSAFQTLSAKVALVQQASAAAAIPQFQPLLQQACQLSSRSSFILVQYS